MTEDNGYSREDRRLDRLLGVLKPPLPSDLLRARVEKALEARPKGPSAAGPRPGRRGAALARIAAALVLTAAVAVASWMPAPGNKDSGAGTQSMAVADPGAAEPVEETAESVSLVGAGGTFGGVTLVRAAWDEPAAEAAANAAASEDELDLIPLD